MSEITLIESEPHEPASDLFNLNALIAHRLKPYEDHEDQLLARKAMPPEPKLSDAALTPYLKALEGIYAALESSSTPTV